MTDVQTATMSCIVITTNSEYHVRDGVCIAVKERATETWLMSHAALGSRVAGTLVMEPGRFSFRVAARPVIGERLCFACDVVTGRVRAVQPLDIDHISELAA